MINVILIEKIQKLGNLGDIVAVKPGYARNFLLPQNKALRATKSNMEIFEKQKAEIEAKQAQLNEGATTISKNIDGKEIILIRTASESGQLYGSVTARDIANEVNSRLGENIKRNHVVLTNPIKTLGIFPQKLVLHGDVMATIHLNVAKSEEEAIQQREAIKAEAKKEADKKLRQTQKAESDALAAKEAKATAKVEGDAVQAESDADVAESDAPIEVEISAEAETEEQA